ncbi:ZP domain-containing protein [Caenorhabditis elegans]|uniref:ZP domain-containing protein n=1 Tax=Caenorhabditis elegans TaxID=6239 RepID=G5EFQ3_CAEEL|nr:ZP domain-containing protein [Caenorhabditis elegans]CAB04922.3 ZP domain-containing protein [Caenorhabditis elegans]|eukprot:NP_507484.3 CUTiclin-Like [Caenorhabditis elegans]
MLLLILIWFLALWSHIQSAKVPRIQNGIVGEPEVICDIKQIRITMRTSQSFIGNLYSKGFFHKSECRVRGNSTANSIEIVLPVDSDCGIRRKRMMNPRGILLDTIVILMFHPVFLTQTDRSYHVQCQYTESERTVTNALDVSMQPASELPQSIQQLNDDSAPVCKYEVLMENAQGPPLSHATVGDLVYHKWSCDGNNKEMYCMTVHSCVVDDGQGFGQKLVDEHGCTLDAFILKELEYNEKELEAGQMSSVFKFADKPTVFFSCMIRVEMKESAEMPCVIPTEVCKNLPSSKMQNLDVMTDRKVSDDIPPGFPRPQNNTKLQKSQKFSTDAMTSNSDYSADFLDDELEDEVDKMSRIPSVTMNRLIRRDVAGGNTKLLADVDVAAPSVNVQDLPESEVGNPTGNRKFHVPTNASNDVCFTRTNLILSLLILAALGIVTISLMYLVISRVTENESASRKTKKLPLPDFSR